MCPMIFTCPNSYATHASRTHNTEYNESNTHAKKQAENEARKHIGPFNLEYNKTNGKNNSLITLDSDKTGTKKKLLP